MIGCCLVTSCRRSSLTLCFIMAHTLNSFHRFSQLSCHFQLASIVIRKALHVNIHFPLVQLFVRFATADLIVTDSCMHRRLLGHGGHARAHAHVGQMFGDTLDLLRDGHVWREWDVPGGEGRVEFCGSLDRLLSIQSVTTSSISRCLVRTCSLCRFEHAFCSFNPSLSISN